MLKRRNKKRSFEAADALFGGCVDETLDLHGCYCSGVVPHARGFIVVNSRKYSSNVHSIEQVGPG
jgi:hypothetical protein